ncbi:hypothetical protein ACFE04_029882 [Oxalis oulophora]
MSNFSNLNSITLTCTICNMVLIGIQNLLIHVEAHINPQPFDVRRVALINTQVPLSQMHPPGITTMPTPNMRNALPHEMSINDQLCYYVGQHYLQQYHPSILHSLVPQPQHAQQAQQATTATIEVIDLVSDNEEEDDELDLTLRL